MATGGSCVNNPQACCSPATCNGTGTCAVVVP
jgi:hypothetical protein